MNAQHTRSLTVTFCECSAESIERYFIGQKHQIPANRCKCMLSSLSSSSYVRLFILIHSPLLRSFIIFEWLEHGSCSYSLVPVSYPVTSIQDVFFAPSYHLVKLKFKSGGMLYVNTAREEIPEVLYPFLYNCLLVSFFVRYAVSIYVCKAYINGSVCVIVQY